MSELLKSIHKDMQALHKSGVIDDVTLRNFDALCLTPVPEFSPDDIKHIRETNHISQGVLAAYLNVTDKAVQKWEQGRAKPAGASAKLLALVQKKGLQAIA